MIVYKGWRFYTPSNMRCFTGITQWQVVYLKQFNKFYAFSPDKKTFRGNSRDELMKVIFRDGWSEYRDGVEALCEHWRTQYTTTQKCPEIQAHCEYYFFGRDHNGVLCRERCYHPRHYIPQEYNVLPGYCPLTHEEVENAKEKESN